MKPRASRHRRALVWPLLVCVLIQANLTTTGHDRHQSVPERRCLAPRAARPQPQIADHLACQARPQAGSPGPQQSEPLKSLPPSPSPCSSPTTTLLSPPTYSTYLATARALLQSLSKHLSTTLSGRPIVLLAQAAPSALYHADQDKEIIVLNSTNFNTELIQYNHPFPHIKLIEYYLPYCGVCLKFKTTYTQLAKDIHPWRNVIRPSAIDLGVSSNSPISHSWSVYMVPTLRIHPPPNPSLATKLNKQLSSWLSTKSPSELQKLMFEQYDGAKLFISSLGVFKYINDNNKKESLSDKVASLKLDLLRYIESYVLKYPDELPATWPNLRPVTETTLMDLRKRHPRQELFLIVEAGAGSTRTSDSDQSSSGSPSLGLHIMMELGSSTAWKAIRYVRASENRALIEDVIAKKKREESSDQPFDGQNNVNGESLNEQVKLLNNLLENRSTDGNSNNNNNILLIHIDNYHSPHGQTQAPQKFPSITIVTGPDLMTIERSAQLIQQQQQRPQNVARSKRAIINHQIKLSQRTRRSLFSPDDVEFDKISLQRKIELVTLYVNQTYTETKEDREFVEALNSLDEDPTSFGSKREAVEKFQTTLSNSNQEEASLTNNDQNSANYSDNTLLGLVNSLNPFDTKKPGLLFSSNDSCQLDDYDDKLKALRYMFFNEIPRKPIIDKSLVEKQEKLNTLVNLIVVIKSYFPLPDSPSIQFIDAVHSYLIKQQSLLSSINSQDRASGSSAGFDTLAFKQELKRFEAEGKRLPEIKGWKYCKPSGYSCAIWRLFHTLTAFEYKKLSQINQLQVAPQQQSSTTGSQDNQPFAETQAQGQEQQQDPNASSGSQNGSSASPIERLVSPPSTTTSLSLTIATPISTQHSSSDSQISSSSSNNNNNNNNNNHLKNSATSEDLPVPVLLVMRDYITNFYGCEECVKNFRQEAAELNLERIRQQPAEFSILWLWETHNRVSKRLSVDPETNPNAHPKNWFPTYEQCIKCYKKPPSFLGDTSIEPSAIFRESIEWNKEEILNFLLREYTRQPMDNSTNIFGYHVPYGFGCIIVVGICSILLIVLLRCALSYYIERQRRHKASLLNGNGAHYSLELH